MTLRSACHISINSGTRARKVSRVGSTEKVAKAPFGLVAETIGDVFNGALARGLMWAYGFTVSALNWLSYQRHYHVFKTFNRYVDLSLCLSRSLDVVVKAALNKGAQSLTIITNNVVQVEQCRQCAWRMR